MPRTISHEYLVRLQQQQAELSVKVKLQKQLYQEQQKRCKNRKVFLIGEMFYEEMETNEHFFKQCLVSLDKRLTSTKDRKLFDLPPNNLVENNEELEGGDFSIETEWEQIDSVSEVVNEEWTSTGNEVVGKNHTVDYNPESEFSNSTPYKFEPTFHVSEENNLENEVSEFTEREISEATENTVSDEAFQPTEEDTKASVRKRGRPPKQE